MEITKVGDETQSTKSNEVAIDLSENLKKLAICNNISNKKAKNTELLNLIESSSQDLNPSTYNSDITNGLSIFEFEAGLPEIDEFNYGLLRVKSHSLVSCVCAQAAYFVGIANKIRRNIESIKSGNKNQTVNFLLNQINKTPGLQIGIIGCGRLGRQLATSLLNFSQVHPHELHISTRQFETLTYLRNKKVNCCYDNAKVASSVNILFLCVLPSQLTNVISDIKNHLPDKCIIYSMVQTETEFHLKNLLLNLRCASFIYKPEYRMTNKLNDSSKWNYKIDITETLSSKEAVSRINPFGDKEEILFQRNFQSNATFFYAIINICTFLGLNKKETLFAFETFLLHTDNTVQATAKKNIELDPSYFFKPETTIYSQVSQSKQKNLDFFPEFDLVDMTLNSNSNLLLKMQSSKTFRQSLKTNFSKFFDEASRYKL